VSWFEPTGQYLVVRYDDVNALLRDRRLGRTYLHVATHAEMGPHVQPAGLIAADSEDARRVALENYQMAEAEISVGQGISARGGHEWHLNTRKLLSAIMLVAALAGIAYWQTLQPIDENEEIDIMLLVDELPVSAYLDNELDAWLDPS